MKNLVALVLLLLMILSLGGCGDDTQNLIEKYDISNEQTILQMNIFLPNDWENISTADNQFICTPFGEDSKQFVTITPMPYNDSYSEHVESIKDGSLEKRTGLDVTTYEEITVGGKDAFYYRTTISSGTEKIWYGIHVDDYVYVVQFSISDTQPISSEETIDLFHTIMSTVTFDDTVILPE